MRAGSSLLCNYQRIRFFFFGGIVCFFRSSERGDVSVSTGITYFFVNFRWQALGDELLVTLADVRQSELYPPVEALLRRPFSLSPVL